MPEAPFFEAHFYTYVHDRRFPRRKVLAEKYEFYRSREE